ncbi:hypothetical protein [Chryseobacterium paridis]|uniref:Uncharacterized protein n=1 Tax=Chryseobacterium paridis TaxID=2800328 RepID=A0ABS1G043_9FLAO|nr:hypothetical protein [Chryseobacterium paridis]MBK1898020.1 hypothetical protein [Chryseobacterium paridis]
MNFGENEILQSLIVELSDTNRISVNAKDNNCDDIYEKLYMDNVEEIDCLFAISLDSEHTIDHFKYSKKNKQTKNKEYILYELLKDCNITFYHYDFKSNTEIQNFIKRIFNLPKKLSRILIYNRYSEYNYFQFLKDKSIHYFNLIPKNKISQRKLEYIRINSDLKANLGRNLVLKTTDDLKLLHERQVFFNYFILHTDQAFDNLLITELNWRIQVNIDRKQCLNEWLKKNGQFVNLN